MTNTRVTIFAALTLMVAFSFGAQAQGMLPLGDFTMYSANHYGIVPPDNSVAGLYQGIVAMAPLPAPGTNAWPCFAGANACPTAPSGSMIIGQPQQVWPTHCDKCGQIFFTFETTSVSGECEVAVSLTQGKTVLLQTAMTKIGKVMPNQIVTVPMTATFTGKPGPATITTATKIGNTVIHGKATIVLQ